MFVVIVNESGLVDSCARVVSFHRREDTAIKAMTKYLRSAERAGCVVSGTTVLTPNDAGGWGRPHDDYYDVWTLKKAQEEGIL